MDSALPTQGGETFRFRDGEVFERYIKPTDLAVWDEMKGCACSTFCMCATIMAV